MRVRVAPTLSMSFHPSSGFWISGSFYLNYAGIFRNYDFKAHVPQSRVFRLSAPSDFC